MKHFLKKIKSVCAAFKVKLMYEMRNALGGRPVMNAKKKMVNQLVILNGYMENEEG